MKLFELIDSLEELRRIHGDEIFVEGSNGMLIECVRHDDKNDVVVIEEIE